MTNKLVLVADDDPETAEIVKACLNNKNFEVISAFDRKSAIEQFIKLNPSLIILDLTLPGTFENDICKEIRKTSKVPIIIITAVSDETSILNSFSNGADD